MSANPTSTVSLGEILPGSRGQYQPQLRARFSTAILLYGLLRTFTFLMPTAGDIADEAISYTDGLRVIGLLYSC